MERKNQVSMFLEYEKVNEVIEKTVRVDGK